MGMGQEWHQSSGVGLQEKQLQNGAAGVSQVVGSLVIHWDGMEDQVPGSTDKGKNANSVLIEQSHKG